MYKYIHDSIKNNSRCVMKELSVPQRKAVSEIVRGLFTGGKPILRHLAQDGNKSAKKQAEKYSHHLGNIDIAGKIDDFALRKAMKHVRRQIVTEISEKLDKKGIWVFDRGNDDKAFFKFLRQNLKVDFIARLKANRHVVMKKTGAITQVRNLGQGKYPVYLMNRNNNKADLTCEYTIVISNHLEDKEPIRLIHSLKYAYPKSRIVTMYLERWGVENIFKRLKDKFELEKIRVLKYKKFVNFVALIQLAVLVSTITFLAIQQSTNALIIGVLLYYKKFIRLKTLGFNLDSFISFMQASLKPLIHQKEKPPPEQLTLLSRRCLEKLGSF